MEAGAGKTGTKEWGQGNSVFHIIFSIPVSPFPCPEMGSDPGTPHARGGHRERRRSVFLADERSGEGDEDEQEGCGFHAGSDTFRRAVSRFLSLLQGDEGHDVIAAP